MYTSQALFFPKDNQKSLLFQTEDTTGEYVGDLGSLNSVNSGSVAFRKEKSAIKLSGSRSVMNRSIVVHADPTGGDRIMCCTIKEYYSP